MKTDNLHSVKMTIIFAVAFFFSFNSFSQTSTVIRGPYLQSGTSTSTIVKWRTSNSTNSQVWYGTDVNNLNQTEVVSGSQTDHQVTVSGLVTNTIYYYAIGDSSGQMEGGSGDASHYFKTAPTIGSSQPVTAWVLGDCGTANNEQQMVRDAYYNYIGSNHTDMVLLLGDNAYDDGFDNEYQTAFFDVYPDKLKNSISWSCPGNHDYFGSGLNNAYYDIFSFPTSGEAGGLSSNTEKYYSFDYANIHVISLDSHDENRNTGSPMLTWLENDLAATTQEWIIVMFHHPPYSKGSHDSDDTSEERMIEMRENVLPICESYGVDLVLSGHSHSYERSKLINGHYGFSNTYDPLLHDIDGGNGQLNGSGAYQQNASVEGTVYVVTGSAGGSSSVGNHPVMYFSKDQVGSTILEVDGNQMDVKFLNENGVVEDFLTLVQNGQPVVNWINPSNGNLFINLDPIALNVDAFDNNGNVTQVEYFINGGSIGIDVVAPYSLSWTPTSFGSFLLKATATDNDGNTSFKEISIIFDDNPTTSLAIQISDGDDDAEELSGDVNLNSSDLELVEENSSNNQTVGLRFNNLNIPNGAMISNAYIQFTADETQSQTTNLTIHGDDIDNSPIFTTISSNVSNRTTTSASATWNPSPWSNVGAAGTNEQTSDLSSVLQEVVDRSGWVENNSMSFIITGSGHRTADSYNGSSGNAPTLHITYTPALNPLPVELTKFQAVQQNAHVVLSWETASEHHTDHFVIERSHNGYSFKEIESVTSQGDGITIQNYNAKDIFPHNGMNYYRLKIVDNDSTFGYSNFKMVHLESSSAIIFFPNPVDKSIQMEGLDETMEDGLIEVFDREGKRIFVDQLSVDDGKLFLSTEAVNIYNPGIYFLRITGKVENHVFKFIKINGT
jgi:hypothetical protein